IRLLLRHERASDLVLSPRLHLEGQRRERTVLRLRPDLGLRGRRNDLAIPEDRDIPGPEQRRGSLRPHPGDAIQVDGEDLHSCLLPGQRRDGRLYQCEHRRHRNPGLLRLLPGQDADAGSPGTAEQYRLLTASIVIEAPLSLIDTISATEGNGNIDRGVYWYENSFYWEEHTIDVLSNDQKIPLAMVAGDLNGDTKADVVIGLNSQEVRNIVVYYNLDNGITWRREFVNQYQQLDKYRAESLALGDLDGDGDADTVAGIRDQSGGGNGVGIIIFWNDGVWTTQVLNYAETPVRNQRSLAVGDMNNDGRPDIVAGDDAGKVKYYRNNVRGAFPIGIAGQFPPGDPSSCAAGGRLTLDANPAIGYK